MKKCLAVFALVFVIPWVAFANPSGSYSVITKHGSETSINYRRRSEPFKMYVSAHADLSFLSWKNEYKYNDMTGEDNFNFESLVGADVALGREFDKNWRADLELGYIGNYSEQETEYYTDYLTEKTDFNLSTIYATANGYYNFGFGVYGGLGVGMAVVKTSLNHTALVGVSKVNFSPMGVVMFGWTDKIAENLNLDIRYRFAAFSGSTANYIDVETKIGWIKANSVSIGVRYEF